MEIVAVIIGVPLVAAMLVDLADIIVKPQWHFIDLYHAGTLLFPLAIVAWFVRMMIREKAERNRKR